MESPRSTPWTRRRLLGRAGQLAAGAAVVPSLAVLACDEPRVWAAGEESFNISTARMQAPDVTLIDGVTALSQRLAPAGWRDLLLRVSNDELDLAAADLAAALARPLARIDRTVPGFEDFAIEGQRGIEPGAPARSLLFHALASSNVFADGVGNTLGAFPTPAELETVENYVFGVAPPSLDEVRGWANGHPLGVVVFALEYRPAQETVHGKHADFCFARTGHARMGTTEAIYDARRRDFLPGDADDLFAFPVQPARYAPFLAVQRPSDPDTFGPLRATEDDRARRFWVPLHKLFSGPECLRGLDLDISLTAGHMNEKLRRFHLRLNNAGFDTGWNEPEINQYPFMIRDEVLATLARDADLGSGWVMPRPHPLVEPAELDGRPLTFFYSPELATTPETIYFSSLQLLERPPFEPLGPGRTQSLPENILPPDADIDGYRTTINPDIGRSSPEYLNVRQKVRPDGTEVDLNTTADVMKPISAGGFWARHFIDHTADGWVAVRCPVLDAEVPTRVPAYSIVCPPSFYPYANQRALTEWAEHEAPEELRDGIWAIPPRPLSDRRLAANVTLPVHFSIDDDTVTAIVSLPQSAPAQQSGEPATQVRRHLQLPDAAAGLFDPGWEVSQDRTPDNRFYLSGYGLGTPFIEDAKLCATLSTFWPGVSPDTAREFQPHKPIGAGESQVWPTIAPMTDEELGIVAADGQQLLPWDGVPGPRLMQVDGVDVVDYPAILHTDYLNTVDRFTAALTSKVDQETYVARVLAMAQVYWALGIRYADFSSQYVRAEALDRFQAAKGEWSVLSYRIVSGIDEELRQAQDATGASLQGTPWHRFHLFQWNGQEMPGDDVSRIRVGIAEQAIAYADLQRVLLLRGETWEHHDVPH